MKNRLEHVITHIHTHYFYMPRSWGHNEDFALFDSKISEKPTYPFLPVSDPWIIQK